MTRSLLLYGVIESPCHREIVHVECSTSPLSIAWAALRLRWLGCGRVSGVVEL